MMVNMLEAKTRLSQLVKEIEMGSEPQILLARNGQPVARIVPLEKKTKIRFGLAKGEGRVPEDPHSDNDYVERLFYGDPEKA